MPHTPSNISSAKPVDVKPVSRDAAQSSDIVERLREKRGYMCRPVNRDGVEAADTIEELVEALERLAGDPDDLHVRQDARDVLRKIRGDA